MDYILNTHVGDLPWETFVSLLITNGTLINLGIAAKPSMEIPYMPLLFNQRKFTIATVTLFPRFNTQSCARLTFLSPLLPPLFSFP